MKIKIFHYNLIIFLIAIYFFNNAFLDGGLVFINVSKSMKHLSQTLDILIMLLAFILICKGKYTKREMGVIFWGYIFIAVVSIMSKRFGLLNTWSFLVLAKQIPYRKWIKTALICCVIILMVGVAATILGFHRDPITHYRSVLGIRYTFGFTHANMTGNYLVEIGMGYMWMQGEAVRKKDFLILICIAAVCFIYPNSIGATLVLMVFICLMWVFRYCRFDKIGMQKFLTFLYYVAIAFVVLDFLLALIDVNSIPILSTIDSVASKRFSEMHRFLSTRGFSIWGKEYNFEFLNYKAYKNGQSRYYADCGWVFMAMAYGMVFEVFFVFLYFSTMRIFVIRGEKVNTLIFFCMALYEMVQNVFPFLGMNFFLIFMAERVFPNLYQEESHYAEKST